MVSRSGTNVLRDLHGAFFALAGSDDDLFDPSSYRKPNLFALGIGATGGQQRQANGRYVHTGKTCLDPMQRRVNCGVSSCISATNAGEYRGSTDKEPLTKWY